MNIIRLYIRILFISCFTLSVLRGYSQQQELNLMPVPANIERGEGEFLFGKDFSISLEGNYHSRLEAEATRFLRRLDQRTGLFFEQNKVTGIRSGAPFRIHVEREGKVTLHEDESYRLAVSENKVELSAQTDIGAIRGLETLLQLVAVKNGKYYLPEIVIADEPRFAWRGLMMDVARHYMPLEVIYRNIDAMACVKLNVLHLHLSDDQGFRFQSEAFPKLTALASDGLYYTQDELRKVVDYADQRGIRVMPEIDVPGHATAILVAYPELGSKDTTYTLERNAGIFDPTLDPTNDEIYTFLATLFEEMTSVFPDAFFHIGGDENKGRHWDENTAIRKFKKANKLKTNHDLQTYFNIRVQKILNDLGRRLVGWEEIMTGRMSKTAVIHSWKGKWEKVTPKQSLYEAARSGFETILSNGYYLDMMQPASYHYAVDPCPSSVALTDDERERILGGEMCMWSELVVPETIDSRLWPRGAAIAERLWSPENVNDTADMYRRLGVISLQLEQLGTRHLTARDVILRKLAGSKEVAPLRTLVELVEPMKGYTRNPGGTMYKSYSPFMLWADAAAPDARVARVFNQQVKEYIAGQSDPGSIMEQLSIWEGNHQQVIPLIGRSPVLKEIEGLSASLSAIAKDARQAISLLEKGEAPGHNWLARSYDHLQQAREQGGRTELQIVDGVELLIRAVARSEEEKQ